MHCGLGIYIQTSNLRKAYTIKDDIKKALSKLLKDNLEGNNLSDVETVDLTLTLKDQKSLLYPLYIQPPLNKSKIPSFNIQMLLDTSTKLRSFIYKKSLSP